jgi:hypothetical protein
MKAWQPPRLPALACEALIQCRGNPSRAARMLGVNRVTVWGRLSEKCSDTTVRHSGMFLAGIQTRAAVGLRCGWIPAKGMPE